MQLLHSWATSDCVLCGGRAPRLVCGPCEASLPRPPAGESVVAPFEYRFPVDALIRRFKFGGDLALGGWLASQLAARVAAAPRPDLLVAPPTTRRRLAERGLNPALHVARRVGRELGIPCEVGGLERTRETAPQPGLGRRERLANLRGAFRCRRRLDGLSVALVDDVVTTGATALALTRVLESAGAGPVAIWAIARTPPPA